MDTKLKVIIEPDGDGYIACAPKLNLYGYAETSKLAVDSLKSEIDSLCSDLMEDNNFSSDWLEIKKWILN